LPGGQRAPSPPNVKGGTDPAGSRGRRGGRRRPRLQDAAKRGHHAADVAEVGRDDHGVAGRGQAAELLDILFGDAQVDGLAPAGLVEDTIIAPAAIVPARALDMVFIVLILAPARRNTRR